MIELSLGAFGAVALLLAGILFSIVTAVLSKLSGDEVSGWLPIWSHRLLESAASFVAPEYRDRYHEEWKAELAAFRDRKLSGLRFAWRLWRRAKSVSAALAENDSLGNVFEPEPAPLASRPLDATAIAEIVRRVVERTRPRNQLRFEEIVEEMREILGDLDEDEVAGTLTGAYVGDISDMRRQARTRPSLPAMRPRQPLPTSKRRLTKDRGGRPDGVVDWGDYDSDWGFLPRGEDKASRRARSGRTSRRGTIPKTTGRTIRSWLRGEIRL